MALRDCSPVTKTPIALITRGHSRHFGVTRDCRQLRVGGPQVAVAAQLRLPSSVESVGNEEAHGLGLALPVGRGGVLVAAAGDLP